ncbi:stealth family protein [Boseongicola aestuarii]|uniref:Capsular polysaccharide phosphotransferase cps12A n=1 Tax=Boseongicola aestuarii TaxID=1470561 RepID=A0A238J2Y1_9RHOB|nr:stealth family protein [Boseongicola aestuarii]SMX24254.1 Capsular polysaccharide phosphotransferase cps12A [Boseongicola aestuarii]
MSTDQELGRVRRAPTIIHHADTSLVFYLSGPQKIRWLRKRKSHIVAHVAYPFALKELRRPNNTMICSPFRSAPTFGYNSFAQRICSLTTDAVITWVDGADPEHAAKRARYSGEAKAPKTNPGASESTRFASLGEIEFCIKLIRKNAPWINTIFLITDAQCPVWLDSAERKRLNVKLVDHRVLFRDYEDVLPTFNSITIETLLHRIPGLSERFLYFNDDFFLIRPTSILDFFENDIPKVYGRIVFRYKKLRKFAAKLMRHSPLPSGLNGVRLGKLGKLPISVLWSVMLGHSPHAIKTADFGKIMDSKRRIDRNIRFRFRNWRQFSPVCLYATLGLNSKSVKVIEPDGLYLIPEGDRGVAEVLEEARSASSINTYLCIQSLDLFDSQSQSAILEFLEEISA